VLYVLNNPVRRGLVAEWGEYQWVWQEEYVNTYAPLRSVG
jgi:hypothetical protein